MLKSLSYEEFNGANIKRNIQRGKEELKRTQEITQVTFDKYHNRTADDLFAETGMSDLPTSEEQPKAPLNYIQVLIALLPYVIGLAALLKDELQNCLLE